MTTTPNTNFTVTMTPTSEECADEPAIVATAPSLEAALLDVGRQLIANYGTIEADVFSSFAEAMSGEREVSHFDIGTNENSFRLTVSESENVSQSAGDHAAAPYVSCVSQNGDVCYFEDGSSVEATPEQIKLLPEIFAALDQIIKWEDCGCDPSKKSLAVARDVLAKFKALNNGESEVQQPKGRKV